MERMYTSLPTVVCTNMSTCSTSYTLTSAVLMRPGHFYYVVRKEDGFAVLDGLQSDVRVFKTWPGAVRQTNFIKGQNDAVTLDQTHDGVHILVYAKSNLLESSDVEQSESLLTQLMPDVSTSNGVSGSVGGSAWVKVRTKKPKSRPLKSVESTQIYDVPQGNQYAVLSALLDDSSKSELTVITGGICANTTTKGQKRKIRDDDDKISIPVKLGKVLKKKC